MIQTNVNDTVNVKKRKKYSKIITVQFYLARNLLELMKHL